MAVATTTNPVEGIVRDIDEKLSELREEENRLARAREALVNGSAPTNGGHTDRRRRARTAPATRTNGRARNGSSSTRRPAVRQRRPRANTRANQALAIVQENPGIDIPKLAERMSLQPNYLYRVMPRLQADGKVRRDGNGWYPVERPVEQ